MPVTDVGTFPSARPDFPGPTSRVGAMVFFVATLAGSGTELWATDGTAAGTQLVRDINAGDGNSFPYDLSPVNGTLFFSADDGVHGRELWKTTPPVPLAPERGDYKNVSAYCKALRAFLGDSEFSQRYKNHGGCVSASNG